MDSIAANGSVGPASGQDANRAEPRSRHYRNARELRSGEVRTNLLIAALEHFGRCGFENASTRGIAGSAGANIAGIVYHFGGKNGLYEAACAYAVERLLAKTAEPLQEIRATLGSRHGHEDGHDLAPGDARALMHRCMEFAVQSLLDDEEVAVIFRFIQRELNEPIVVDGAFMSEMLEIYANMAELVGVALDVPPDSELVRIRTLLLASQLDAFTFIKPFALRSMGWDSLGDPEKAVIGGAIAASVESLLSPP